MVETDLYYEIFITFKLFEEFLSAFTIGEKSKFRNSKRHFGKPSRMES